MVILILCLRLYLGLKKEKELLGIQTAGLITLRWFMFFVENTGDNRFMNSEFWPEAFRDQVYVYFVHGDLMLNINPSNYSFNKGKFTV